MMAIAPEPEGARRFHTSQPDIKNRSMIKMYDVKGDIKKGNVKQGHITAGIKHSGKDFMEKYAYNIGDYLVFVTKMGQVIKNCGDIFSRSWVVA
jgi:hypothetical protein